jgi:hypothetical protein
VCFLLRAEGFSCSLDVLYKGLGISKLQFFLSKNGKKIQLFFYFWSYPESDPDLQHCRNVIHSSCREERERLTGEKVAQLLCPDEEEVPSQEEAVRYLSLQGKGASAVRISRKVMQSWFPLVYRIL